jgi:hypothetical protein
MDYLVPALKVISVLGIFVLGLMTRRYLPAYATKKGENLATKEDIGEITRIIEGVRSQNATELELVRGALQQASQWQTSLAEVERNTIVDFFDECVELIFGKVQTNLGELPIADSGRSLFEYQTGVREQLVMILKRYHRLILYLKPGSEIATAAQKFATGSIGFGAAFRKHFGRLKSALIDEGEAAKKADRSDYSPAVSATDAAAKTYQSAIQPFTNVMSEALRDLMVAGNKHLRSGATAAEFEALAEALKNAGKESAPLIRR